MAFKSGDQVEVCSKEDGFLGSYYTATVVSQIGTSSYAVQYKNLVEEDECTPLTEVVKADELRPMPPKPPFVSSFCYLDMVDAFDNDGWWVGKITRKKGCNYYVYFDTTRDEIAYHVSRLRFHQDWFNGNWIITSKKGVV
ncbi:Agenet domain-containing protein [Cephalotus follicularis]|uniref:Agenet domain-containing protein n=1 Tax=Cephalotus follicularis TaxID=3775 RepID=A0A1Q3CB12_CEPFO|nr:Agenet domain-containing protein [Cephalotus follicularis]